MPEGFDILGRKMEPGLGAETPTDFADRVGQEYLRERPESHRKGTGQYFTAPQVARFMAGWCRTEGATLRILDPGAGAGILACALCEALAVRTARPQRIQLTAYETDTALAERLHASLRYAEEWLFGGGIAFEFRICAEDFVLAHAGQLGDAGLFADQAQTGSMFDVVIANPPYFKIPKSDRRAQAAAEIVHGQPNIYALFMAMAAALLRPGGELLCISPRSFASGPYFRQFRQFFFARMQPARLHLFQSRREAFQRDEVLQENVILRAARRERDETADKNAVVVVSSSEGVADLTEADCRTVPLAEILNPAQERTLHIPAEARDSRVAGIVRRWPGSLQTYGLAISTGPVVPFRATQYIEAQGEVPATHAPLLWMQHIQPMRTTWPLVLARKLQYLRVEGTPAPLLTPNKNYVLLRRFSSKEQARRLIAAPYQASCLNTAWLGLENHLNYLYRPGGELTPEETYGLAALLNSALMDTYFRISCGHTQVNAMEIRVLPLPPLEVIREIGARCLAAPFVETEAIVNDTLQIDHDLLREERARYVAN
jgi:adenine-specific DNA-methyltransferase